MVKPRPKNALLIQVFVAAQNSIYYGKGKMTEIMERANRISSQETNIHIQVIGYWVFQIQPLTKEPWLYYSNKISEFYGSKGIYDMAFLFMRESEAVIASHLICNKNAIHAISTRFLTHPDKYEDYEDLSKFVVGSIYVNAMMEKGQDCSNCTTKQQFCLNSTYLHNKPEDDNRCKEVKDWDCLNDFRFGWKQEEVWPLTIHGNGVVEKGEECDCWYHTPACSQTCDENGKLRKEGYIGDEEDGGIPDYEFVPSERESSLLIYIIAVSIVGACLLIAIVIGVIVVKNRKFSADLSPEVLTSDASHYSTEKTTGGSYYK